MVAFGKLALFLLGAFLAAGAHGTVLEPVSRAAYKGKLTGKACMCTEVGGLAGLCTSPLKGTYITHYEVASSLRT